MADSTMLEYKCPCCGGAIEFDSELQKLRCPYCDTQFDVETLKQYDEGLKDTVDHTTEWESYTSQSGTGDWREGETDGMVTFVCQSCGGEIIGDSTTAATSCPYCGNPVIIMPNFSGTLRPDSLIPFKINKEEAKKALAGFLKGKPLLPDMFSEENRIDSIKGIYVPFWLYDADADASIQYRATKLSHWSDSNYDYTRTSYFQLLRSGNLSFERVPVDGSQKMDDTYMEAIEPFNYDDLVPFGTPYLAGFLANKYDIDSDAGSPRANERIKNSTLDTFASTVHGYSTCTVQSANINLSNKKIQYALLPVWMLNTEYKGKQYCFAMNGQTGRFIGKLPVDYKKFWKYWGIIAACIAAVGTLISYFI